MFSDYVNKLYNMKSHPKNVTQKLLAKSLLNNLLGRFGMDFTKPFTDIVEPKAYSEIELTRKISSRKVITDNDILVTYSPDIDKSICEGFNIDYNEALKDPNIAFKVKNSGFKGVSLVIATAVTAYGRIHINKIKNKIFEMNGNIYYSDTDSIVTDIELPSDMIDPKAIGKLKLEHKIKKGYFISAKTYCLITDDEKVIIKAKGVKKNTLSESDFIDMYNGEDIKTAIKSASITDYSEGSVVISEKQITLNAKSYLKRNKIYKDNV